MIGGTMAKSKAKTAYGGAMTRSDAQLMAQRVKNRVNSGFDALEAEKEQRKYQEYLNKKTLNDIASPNMADESMASYAQYKNTKGAQLATYDSLADDVRSQIENIRDTKNDEKILGVFTNPFATDGTNLENEFKQKYGLSDDAYKAIEKVSKDAANRDEFNAQYGDGKWEQIRNDNAAKNYTRTYDEEIDYAKSKFSSAAPNVNELRADITAYNSMADQKAKDYFTRPTLIESIKQLASGDDSKTRKNEIMNKYGLSSDEFDDLAYYGKELDDYDNRLDQQAKSKASVNTDDTATNVKNGIANSAIALTTNPMAGFNGIAETGKYYANRLAGTSYDRHSPINPNSAGFAASNLTTDTQSATQEAVNKHGALAGILYGGAMSAAESAETSMLAPAATVGMGVKVASALGRGAKTAGAITRAGRAIAGLTPFAANAFTNSLSENVSAGKEMDEAMTQAMIDTGIEVGTEIVSFDKFWDLAQGNSKLARNVVVNFLMQAGIEGSEEAIGDVADLIVDELRHGENSDFNQSVRNYMANGMSEQDAINQANRDWFLQLAEDFASGAVSGALGGAGATAINVGTNFSNAQEFFNGYTSQDYADFAEAVGNDQTEDGSYTNKSANKSALKAKELAEKYSKQKYVSNTERARLYEVWQDAVAVEEEAARDAAAEEDERRAAEKRMAKKIGQDTNEAPEPVDGKNVFEGAPEPTAVKSRGKFELGENGMPVVTKDFLQYAGKQNRAVSDKQIAEAIPASTRVESNNSTPEEIHADMAKATSISELEPVVLRGAASTNPNTRTQTWQSLQTLSDKFKANGITDEELASLRRSDTDLYRAAFNGEDVKTFTTRSALIANTAKQNAITIRTENNKKQQAVVDAHVETIKSANVRNVVAAAYQQGQSSDAFISMADTIAAGVRSGMSPEEAMSKAKPYVDLLGDTDVTKSAVQKIYDANVEYNKAEWKTELRKLAGTRGRVGAKGIGEYTDLRSDDAKANGAHKIEGFAKTISSAFGYNVVVFDKTSNLAGVSKKDRESNGFYSPSNSTIYINADGPSSARTFLHENVEFASVWNDKGLNEVSKLVNKLAMDTLGTHEYNKMREQYKAAYKGEKGKSETDLDKEIAADIAPALLLNEDGMRKFLTKVDALQNKKQARTIKEKLKLWLENLSQALKDFVSGDAQTSWYKKMGKERGAEIDKIIDMLAESMVRASENYKASTESKPAITESDYVVSETTSKTDNRNSIEVSDEDLNKAFDPNNKEHIVLPNGIGQTDSDGTLRFNQQVWDSAGKDFLEDYLKRNTSLTQKQKDDIMSRMQTVSDMMNDLASDEFRFYNEWAALDVKRGKDNKPIAMIHPNGAKSVIVANGEYKLNDDFSRICKKRVALNKVLNALVDKYGLNLPTLTESDINFINKSIKENGFEIACGLCFVDAKRYRVGRWAESFTGDKGEVDMERFKKQSDDDFEITVEDGLGYNNLLRMIKAKDGKPVAYSYFNFAAVKDGENVNEDANRRPSNARTIDTLSEDEIDKSALLPIFKKFAIMENGEVVGLKGKIGGNSPTEEMKMAYSLYMNPEMRHLVANQDLISSDGLDAIRDENAELYDLVNSHGGASKPKNTHTQVVYSHENLASKNFTEEKAKYVGGVRIQSFSDYEANLFFDYCELLTDLSAKELTSHSYTKEVVYARLFGLTGVKINLSLVSRAADLTSDQMDRLKNLYTENGAQAVRDDAEFNPYLKNAGLNLKSIDAWKAKNADKLNAWLEEHGETEASPKNIARAMTANGMTAKDILLFEDETFPVDDALAIQKEDGYSYNCGVICIGISDDQIAVMLDMDDIPMIIPYHASGVAQVVKVDRALMLYNDYTNEQNTRERKSGGKWGKLAKGKKDFDFYGDLYGRKEVRVKSGKNEGKITQRAIVGTNDPATTAEHYKEWCKKNGYLPKFAKEDWQTNPNDFANHPNYYKLLIDFRVYDYNGVDAERMANRKYLPQKKVELILPDNTKELVIDSLRAQQETIDALDKDFANEREDGKEGVLSKVSKYLDERGNGNRHSNEVTELPQLDSEGNPLSIGQRKFNANSKAVDENGRLKRMYHGSESAGFVVFDPSMSDDGISLFFTDDEEVAASYSGTMEAYNPYEPREELTEAEKKFAEAFGYPTDGRTSGNYSVYLNLENPLVVDYGGKKWNDYTIKNDAYREDVSDLITAIKRVDPTFNFAQILEIRTLMGKSSLMDIIKDLDEMHAEDNGSDVHNLDGIRDVVERIDSAVASGELGVTWRSWSPNILHALMGGEISMSTRTFAKLAKDSGRDGVIFKNIVDIGSQGHGDVRHKASTVMVAFRGNQVKDVRNLEPTDADDMRFSQAVVDTNNEPLTEGMKSYMAESMIKDEHNRLMVMHHGTPVQVEIREFKHGRYGFFFTDSKAVAESYAGGTGNVYDVYLNIKHPYVRDYHGKTWDADTKYDESGVGYTAAQIERDFLKKINKDLTIDDVLGEWMQENEYRSSDDLTEYSIKDAMDRVINRRGGIPVNKSGKAKVNANRMHQLADLLQKQLYDEGIYLTDGDSTSERVEELMDFVNYGERPMKTDDWVVYAKRHGHDGLRLENIYDMGSYDIDAVASTIVVAFESNQIKWVGNENPTDSPDIKRSLNIDDRQATDADIEDSQYEIASILGAGAELLKDGKVNKSLCRSIAIEMKNKYNSAYDVDDLTNKLAKAFAYLQSGSNVNHADFVAIMDEIARLVVDEAYTPASAREDYANFREKINGMTFSISKEQAAAIRETFGSRSVFNKYFPEIHIDEKAPSLDSQWADIVDASGYLIDEYTDHDDMVIALAQAFEDLKPTVGFEDATQMAHDMSLDIIARYLGNYHASGATKGVINEYTQKAANDIKVAHAEWKKQAEIKYAQRLAEERQYQKELAKDRADKKSARTAEQIAKLKAKNKERISDIRDRQKRNAQLKQIKKTVNTLYDYLSNPTDEKHIYKTLQEPIFELLQGIDLSSPTPKINKDGKWQVKVFAGWTTDENGKYKYNWKTLTADTRDEVVAKYYKALSEGYGGKNTRKWYDRMQDISKMFNRSGDMYEGNEPMEVLDFKQSLDKDLGPMLDKVLEDAAKRGAESFSDLSLDDLRTVNAVVKNVLHAVNYINRSLSMPSETVKGISEGVMDHAEAVNGRKNRDRRVENVVDFLSLTNANPHTYLHAIGANKAIDILIKAQNDKAFKLREAQEHSKKFLSEFTEDELKAWDKEGSYLGGKVVATKAQVMTIYELLQRPDATLHLLEGGFRVGSIGNKTTTQNRTIRLSLDEYEALIDEALTEKDKQAADDMQQFMAVNCAAWGNATSMAMYGYEKFRDDRYWPMKVVGSTVNTNMSEMMGGIANTIKNMGMTKATVKGASNPLLIDGALDVYAKHISDMAVYSAWTAPIQDLIRFFNYREKDENGQMTRSTKDAIELMFGVKGTEYFKKLMASIQGTEQSSFEDGGILAAAMGNAKKAAVMANLRVVVQQPTAIYRAAKRIDGKYLNAGVLAGQGELEQLRQKMIGSDAVYWIKQQGNIDGFITNSIKTQITGVQTLDEKVTDKAGWLAGMADQVTWDAMYRACIANQIDVLGRDKIGTQEFQDAVNYQFDHLMLETQVYDGTITRTQFMRSTDMYMKNASSFMAEPAKTYNIVLSDMIDLQQSKKGSEERKEAKRQLLKTARVLFTTAAVNALAQSVWDAVRNAGDPDEEDKAFWQRVIEAIGWDFDAESLWDQTYAVLHGNLVDGLNILNNIPIIADLAEITDTQLSKLFWNKTSYSSSSSMETAWLTNLFGLVNTLTKIARDPDNNEVSNYGLFQKTARVVSDVTGWPVYAAQRDAVAIYNQIGGRAFGAPMLSASKTSNKKQSKNDVYDVIMNSTDLDEVRAAVDEALEKGNSYDAINNAMKSTFTPELKQMSTNDAIKTINRIAEVKAYISDQEGTNADKTHAEKVEKYKKDIKKWLE